MCFGGSTIRQFFRSEVSSLLTPKIENQNFVNVDTPKVRNPFKLPFCDCRLHLFGMTNCSACRLLGLVIVLRDELIELLLDGADEITVVDTRDIG